MITKLLCATLALGPFVGVLLAADAFTGRWTLDIASSTFASDYPVPKAATLTFTEQGANRIQVLTRSAADGSTTSTEWRAPLTGGIVTFPAGQGPNGGASLNVGADNTLVLTQNLRLNRVGASRTYHVSADGETLTLIIVREDRQERARMVFRRQ